MASEKEENKPELQEKNIFEDLVGDILSLERGLPATFMTILRSPRRVFDSYFANENKFVNPFKYTIFILAVVTLVNTTFVDYEAMMEAAAQAGTDSVEEMNENLRLLDEETGINFSGFMTAMKDVSVGLLTKYSQVFYILVMAPLLAFSSRLFFKSIKPKFKHHYVMMLYSVATFAVFSLLMLPMLVIPDLIWVQTAASSILLMIFMMYVQIKYLDLKGFDGYMMSFLSFIIGYILYFIGTFLVQIFGGIILVIARG
jgi:hypothetical protein